MRRLNDINICFNSGKYKDVLAVIGREPLDVRHRDYEALTAVQIGSLIFLGDFLEAQNLFSLSCKIHRPSHLFLCRSRFYLGIGYVRRSAYDEAAKMFAHNLADVRGAYHLSAEVRYYAFQGAAFFRFFKGDYVKCVRTAEMAYSLALEAGLIQPQLLSLDLLGHSLCLSGSVRRGMREFEKSIGLAVELGDGGMLTALRISHLKYSAQFGLDVKNAVSQLRHALETLEPEDTYSRAELHLELSRQLVLRGLGRDARIELERASGHVFRHQHKRQTAILNLRFAYLFYLQGDASAALALTSALRSNLDLRVDRAILCQADGLVAKINSLLSSDAPLGAELRPTAQAQIVVGVNARILQRESRQKLSSAIRGDDPLGDLIDQLTIQPEEAFEEVRRLELFGLLPRLLGLPHGMKGIFLGPSRKELILIDGANVFYRQKNVTSSVKRLILGLAGSEFKSKEVLVRRLWGYDYDPRIHDALLYAAIGKLRRVLGEFFPWVEWTNQGYRLNPQLHILSYEQKTSPRLEEDLTRRSGHFEEVLKSEAIELNFRQVKLMRKLNRDEAISVRDYMMRNSVCSMTAYRDLKELFLAGKLVRVGKGRSTVYLRADSAFEQSK
jgi:hypothetical protein